MFAHKLDFLYFTLGAVLSQPCEKDVDLNLEAYISWLLIQAKKNYVILKTYMPATVPLFREW